MDAEQARRQLTIRVGSDSYTGMVKDVGVDYVALRTATGTVDLALFHILSVAG